MMRRALVAIALLLAPAIATADRTIVIDAGHGGGDPGGVGNNMLEKNLVLDVSKRFKALLDADTADDGGGGAWSARLTRNDDSFVSLAARAAFSNNVGADRFMSIHSNAFGDPSANGTETFAFSEGGQGAALRNLVQAEMLAAWGLRNRGNKTANFAVLRETAAPAILHELAFITNAVDAAKLASADERQKAAIAHLRAIQRHFGIAPYVPGEAGPVAKVGEIAGRVVDANGPIEGATVRLDSGAEVVTPADGTFVFDDVAAGDHVVTASAPDHATATADVTVLGDARADAEIELVLDDGDGDGDGDPSDPPDETGGCNTGGGGGGAALALGLVALARRRRRS